MPNYTDLIKRMLSKPGLSLAEKEGIEDLTKSMPKSTATELSAANPGIAKQSELEQTFAQPKSAAIDESMGMGDVPKSAEESAATLQNTPSNDFTMGKESPTEILPGQSKDIVPYQRNDITLSKGSDYTASPSSDIPTSSTPKSDSLADILAWAKNNPVKTGAGALAGYSAYKAMQGSGKGAVKPPVAAQGSQDEEDEDEESSTAKSGQKAPAAPVKKSSPQSSTDTPVSAPSIAPPVDQTSDFMTRLRAAQQSGANTELVAGLGKAAELIGSGISRTSPIAQKNFDEISKSGQGALNDFMQRTENLKNDPNSEMSKAYRTFATQTLGVKGIDPNASASDLKTLEPLFEKYIQAKDAAKARQLALQQRSEDKSDAASVRADDKMDKRFSDLNKTLVSEVASSRTTFGRASGVVRSAEAVQTLANAIPDPNNLDTRQITEIARNLDSMLSNGASTVAGSNKLIPNTWTGDAAKITEYIMSIPKGAQQGDFVRRMLDTVGREKDLATSQVKRTQNKILGGYSDLKDKDPDRYNSLLRVHNLPVEGEEESTSPQRTRSNPSFDDLGFKGK